MPTPARKPSPAPVAYPEGATIELGPDGAPYVRETRTSRSEPKICTWWWPLASESRTAALALAGEPLDVSGVGDCYRIAPRSGAFRGRESLRLWIDGGKHARPARYEEATVSRPARVRSELRWRAGGWEKLSPKGWVAA